MKGPTLSIFDQPYPVNYAIWAGHLNYPWLGNHTQVVIVKSNIIFDHVTLKGLTQGH